MRAKLGVAALLLWYLVMLPGCSQFATWEEPTPYTPPSPPTTIVITTTTTTYPAPPPAVPVPEPHR